MNTYYDILNAVEFAHNSAFEHQYLYFLNKYPHIFKYVDIQSRPATNKDYYVPASIANECKIYSVSFNEIGCRKISCFPKTGDLKDCTETDPTTFIAIGDTFHLSCQPACHEISKLFDTEFKDGKCLLMNTDKKIFALFPEQAHGVEIYQPLHQGLNLNKDGNLVINKDYCTAFGLNFENEECIAPVGQEIGEFFLGSTIYRSMKKLKPSTNLKVSPPVPNDVQNLNIWLEGSPRIQKSTSYQSNITMPYIPPETLSEIFKNLSKNLALDVGVDISTEYTLKVMKKRIPKAIMKHTNTAIGTKVFQSALMKTIVQSHVRTLASVSKSVLGALSALNIAIGIFGAVSTIVDLFDPFNYNYVLDKETLSKINKHLDYTFYRSNNKIVEITPDNVWNVMEDDMSLYMDKLEEKIDYYLNAVALEDYDTRLKTQKEISERKKIKNQYNWHKVFHVFFVMVLIIISLLFIQYVAYFVLIYFVFILYSYPSFY